MLVKCLVRASSRDVVSKNNTEDRCRIRSLRSKAHGKGTKAVPAKDATLGDPCTALAVIFFEIEYRGKLALELADEREIGALFHERV
jgi:hypothetical protein